MGNRGTAFFQNLYRFPKRNDDNSSEKGKARPRKEKTLSSESVSLSKKAGYIEKYPEKEREVMKNNNQINIPQAREAMDRFKMQAASEVGVNLTNGYNGHLTSREAGSVGGQMVKNALPERTKYYIRKNRIKEGHCAEIRYIIRLAV